MSKRVGRVEGRKKRHRRVRKQVLGTSYRPRLSVFRSNRHLYSQIIDDVEGKTLVGISSRNEGIRSQNPLNNVTVGFAKQVGMQIGKLAMEKGITQVVFDRGGYRYHGQIKAFAEGAREAGLQF